MPPSLNRTYQKWLSGTLLVCSLVFIAFLQFYRLGELPIVQWDESRLAVNAAEMSQSHNYLISTYENQPDLYNTKPPLMIWLQVACISVFGLNEFAIRFPSALAGFCCILLCGYVIYRHYQQLFTACFAMLLLAGSKGFIQLHGSLTGDYDSLLALWIFAASYHFYRGFLSGRKTSSRVYFTLFLALAVISKSAAALVIFPVFILVLLPQKNARKLITACLLCVLALVPFILFCIIREHAATGYLQAIQDNDFGGRFSKALEGHTSEWHYYIVNLFDYRFHYLIWLLPIALVYAYFSKDRYYRYYSFLCIGYLFFISLARTRIHWYDTPALPMVAVVIAMFCAAVYYHLKNRNLKIAYICLLVIAMLIPAAQKYQFITHREGLELDMGHYELSNMIRDKHMMHDLKYIANHYDAEFYFYTKDNPHVIRGDINSLAPGDIVATGNLYKDSVRLRYNYILLDTTQNAQKLRITGIK